MKWPESEQFYLAAQKIRLSTSFAGNLSTGLQNDNVRFSCHISKSYTIVLGITETNDSYVY